MILRSSRFIREPSVRQPTEPFIGWTEHPAKEIPSYADASQVASADERIRGRIASFDGAHNLTVDDERGFVDNVDLHDGTIINLTGLSLAPRTIVSILRPRRHWLLEIHFVDRTCEIGGFFEKFLAV